MKFLYLLVNFGAFIIPFLFSFHPKLLFYKKWRFLWPAIFFSAIPFILWDIYFTSIGVWGFNHQYILRVYIANLPLEEVLFFVCIPYACIFTYHCFSILIKRDFLARWEKYISSIIFILLIIIGITYADKMYTILTCLSFLALLVFAKLNATRLNLSRFYFTYFVLLLPFTLVNGILTGTGLDQPVVWYNNLENLNIRILTIPVEDIFYGMALILLNILFYEYFKGKHQSKENYHSGISL
jgi:lycopene cyclase domain-containing protein